MSLIHVLWDDSHIWGLLLTRALEHYEYPYRLVSAHDVQQGILQSQKPDLLIVPGGNARRKGERLGRAGQQAIRDYVEAGGTYLGFCGGTGLALSGTGLGLCPWKRKPFANRFQHLVSGYLHVRLADSPLMPQLPEHPMLPVWWPGRFEETADDPVTVLARYEQATQDLWIADLCLRNLPETALADWHTLYGLHLSPDFMQGQPCMITGEYGKGRYILSYAHLETPASPDANGMFLHLLQTICNTPTTIRNPVPAWNLGLEVELWNDPVLTSAELRLHEIIKLGKNHLLLFWRTPWLLGWRRGLPGLAINSLYALVLHILSHPSTAQARTYWAEIAPDFNRIMDSFHKGVIGYLLAERLDMTLTNSPDQPALTGLKEQRSHLFGPPPSSGGLYGQLLEMLEHLALLQQDSPQ